MNRCELCQGPTDSIGLCYNQTCRNYRGNPILQPEPSIESKVRILTPCPACNSTTLFVSDNGKLCCSLIGCSNPLAINEVASERDRLKELKDAAQGVCGYLITLSAGHVTFESPLPPENLKRLEAALAKP